MNINFYVKKIHENSKNKGFWNEKRNIGELLMLIVSEVGEAFEAESDENFNEEIADILIRLFDLCGGLNIEPLIAYESKPPGDPPALVRGDDDLNIEFMEIISLLSKVLEANRIDDATFDDSVLKTIEAVFYLCDLCAIDIEKEISKKMLVNEQRPYKHGKKY